jgi:hypothetical protein
MKALCACMLIFVGTAAFAVKSASNEVTAMQVSAKQKIIAAFEALSRQKRFTVETRTDSHTGALRSRIEALLPDRFRVQTYGQEASEMVFTPDGTMARSMTNNSAPGSWLPVQMGEQAIADQFSIKHFRQRFSGIDQVRSVAPVSCDGKKAQRYGFRSANAANASENLLDVTISSGLPCAMHTRIKAENGDASEAVFVRYRFDQPAEIALPAQ